MGNPDGALSIAATNDEEVGRALSSNEPSGGLHGRH